MPRAVKNSLGVVCPHSTRVLGKEGEVGSPSRAGEGGGVSKRGDMGPGYFAKADVSEREGHLGATRVWKSQP